MKPITTKFYHINEKLYRCKRCGISDFPTHECPECKSRASEHVEMIVPKILDELILVGGKTYDVVTYDGEAFPAWVDFWGKLDLSPL